MRSYLAIEARRRLFQLVALAAVLALGTEAKLLHTRFERRSHLQGTAVVF
jgi:hypothetical protein